MVECFERCFFLAEQNGFEQLDRIAVLPPGGSHQGEVDREIPSSLNRSASKTYLPEYDGQSSIFGFASIERSVLIEDISRFTMSA